MPALKILRRSLWIFISIFFVSLMADSLFNYLPRASGLEERLTIIGSALLEAFIAKWMFYLLDDDPNREIFSFKIPNNPASILSVFLGVFWGVMKSQN